MRRFSAAEWLRLRLSLDLHDAATTVGPLEVDAPHYPRRNLCYEGRRLVAPLPRMRSLGLFARRPSAQLVTSSASA